MRCFFGHKKHIVVLVVSAISLLCIPGCQSTSENTQETGTTTETGLVTIEATTPSYCPTIGEPEDIQGLFLTTFNTDNFAGSGQCTACHQNLTDGNGNSVSITSDWCSTMMANAAKDPLWQAKVSSEIARNPDLQEVIEDKCATCHMPMARTQSAADDIAVGIIDSGLLDTGNSLHDAAMDGVSCTLCHQIQAEGLGEDETFSGKYQIDTTSSSPNRLIYGPFDNQQQMQMKNMVGFIPVFGEQTTDSGLCAACHTLYTPYINSQGEIAGEFPEQTPYLEWEASRYGDGTDDDLSCQDCHMPAADTPVVISTLPGNLSARDPFARHYFVGGNKFMLGIIMTNLNKLDVTASSAQLATTISRIETQLSDNTASISLLSAQKEGETLALQVLVNNSAGHKLPTGFPSRRMWIHITVKDSSGQIVFESGKPASDGSIIGNDADFDPAEFEPHYDTITGSDQVQIYESIMQDTDGNVTYTLLRAAAYVKDNRILPEGFDPENVGEDIAVYGEASGDDDFQNGEDKVEYLIPVAGKTGPFEITLSLLYQTAGFRFLNDLEGNDTDEIRMFAELLDEACNMPEIISIASYRIQ